MPNPTFLVFADLHIREDYLKKFPHPVGDSYFALSQIVDLANKTKEQFPGFEGVILAGDIFDNGKKMTPNIVEHTKLIMSSLRADIEAYGIEGQHDLSIPAKIAKDSNPPHCSHCGMVRSWLDVVGVENINSTLIVPPGYSYRKFDIAAISYRPTFSEFLEEYEELMPLNDSMVLITHQFWVDGYKHSIGELPLALSAQNTGFYLSKLPPLKGKQPKVISGDIHRHIVFKDYSDWIYFSPNSTYPRSVQDVPHLSFDELDLLRNDRKGHIIEKFIKRRCGAILNDDLTLTPIELYCRPFVDLPDIYHTIDDLMKDILLLKELIMTHPVYEELKKLISETAKRFPPLESEFGNVKIPVFYANISQEIPIETIFDIAINSGVFVIPTLNADFRSPFRVGNLEDQNLAQDQALIYTDRTDFVHQVIQKSIELLEDNLEKSNTHLPSLVKKLLDMYQTDPESTNAEILSVYDSIISEFRRLRNAYESLILRYYQAPTCSTNLSSTTSVNSSESENSPSNQD
jgi:hypothetical protein